MKPQFDCMYITNIKIKYERLGNAIATADIVLNDQFIVRGLRIINGANGLFVAYPIKTMGDDVRSVCNPITRQLREQIENLVLTKYQKEKPNETV